MTTAARWRGCDPAHGWRSKDRTARSPRTPGAAIAILLAGAGVGITPIRALLEELPRDADVVVLLRGSRREDLVLRDEIAELTAARGGRVHELVGPRERVRLDAAALAHLAPGLADRDVYVCGPDGFSAAIATAAREAGVRPERIHHESFVL